MRAKISADSRRSLRGHLARSTADGVVDEPLTHKEKITRKGEDLLFDMTASARRAAGPMNSVLATTKSAIYLAVKQSSRSDDQCGTF